MTVRDMRTLATLMDAHTGQLPVQAEVTLQANQFEEEKFSLLQFQADEMDDASKNMIIRKAIKLLLKDPELTADFTFPYCDLQKQHPKNTAKLYEFVMNKGEEFQRTRKPRQTAAVAAGALGTPGGAAGHRKQDGRRTAPRAAVRRAMGEIRCSDALAARVAVPVRVAPRLAAADNARRAAESSQQPPGHCSVGHPAPTDYIFR